MPAKRLAPGRAALQGTERKRAAFLREYALSGNVSETCRVVGISRKTHYDWLRTDPAYVKAFNDADASAVDALEKEARRRAVEGVEEGVYYKGERVDTVRKFSDLLLIFLLKGARPEKYRDRVDVAASSTLTINLVSNIDPAALSRGAPALPAAGTATTEAG